MIDRRSVKCVSLQKPASTHSRNTATCYPAIISLNGILVRLPILCSRSIQRRIRLVGRLPIVDIPRVPTMRVQLTRRQFQRRLSTLCISPIRIQSTRVPSTLRHICA
jgi:hypothetical protein